MASIKGLKKEIDNSFAELGFLCHVVMATAEDTARADEVAGIYSETVEKVEELMARVNRRDKKLKGKEVKVFFKSIRAELTELFTQRTEQLTGMIAIKPEAVEQ